MHRDSKISTFVAFVSLSLAVTGSGGDRPALGHEEGFVGGSHQAVVVETTAGLGIYQYDHELLLVTSDGRFVALDQPDVEIIYAWPDGQGGELNVYKFDGAECQPEAPCPGGVLRQANANIYGCVRILNACWGSCTDCAGSSNSGRFCAEVADINIVCFQTISPTFKVDCGQATKYDCNVISGGPGTPPRPNGCECDTSTTARPQTYNCNVNTCIP